MRQSLVATFASTAAGMTGALGPPAASSALVAKPIGASAISRDYMMHMRYMRCCNVIIVEIGVRPFRNFQTNQAFSRGGSSFQSAPEEQRPNTCDAKGNHWSRLEQGFEVSRT